MNDHKRVQNWPEMHWTFAGYICVALVALAAFLISYKIMSYEAAMWAVCLAIGYVIVLTGHLARANKPQPPDETPAP